MEGGGPPAGVATTGGRGGKAVEPPKLILLPSQRRKLAILSKLGVVAQKLPVNQFVHWAVDELCGRKPDWSKPFGEANAQPMIDAVKLLVTKAVGGGLKKDDIVRELNEYNVPEEHASVLVECVLVRYTEVQKILTAESSQVSLAHLKDFDWKLLHSLASDKMATVNEPILRLNLTIKDESEKLKDVVLELPKAELDKLIATLQQANQVVQKLKI